MNTETRAPLTDIQETFGLIEARRIINQAAGYYFAGDLIPFADGFKEQALRAIGQMETRVEVMDALIRNTAHLMSTRAEGKSIEESYIAAYRLLFAYIYPDANAKEHVDDCELLTELDLTNIKDVLRGEPSLVGSLYQMLVEKLDLTTEYAKKFQKFTQSGIK